MAKQQKQSDSIHDRDRIIVRLPDGMRERLAALAESNGRSMTAEVVAALEQHLTGPSRMDAFEARTKELDKELGELWGMVEDLERKVSDHDVHLFPNKYDD